MIRLPSLIYLRSYRPTIRISSRHATPVSSFLDSSLPSSPTARSSSALQSCRQSPYFTQSNQLNLKLNRPYLSTSSKPSGSLPQPFGSLYSKFLSRFSVTSLSAVAGRSLAGVVIRPCRGMATYGNEYQPSTVRRKRRWGFLVRMRSKAGQKILKRRALKGRKYLSH